MGIPVIRRPKPAVRLYSPSGSTDAEPSRPAKKRRVSLGGAVLLGGEMLRTSTRQSVVSFRQAVDQREKEDEQRRASIAPKIAALKQKKRSLTQSELIEEALQTEELNRASLQAFYAQEEKRREAETGAAKWEVIGPKVRFWSRTEGVPKKMVQVISEAEAVPHAPDGQQQPTTSPTQSGAAQLEQPTVSDIPATTAATASGPPTLPSTENVPVDPGGESSSLTLKSPIPPRDQTSPVPPPTQPSTEAVPLENPTSSTPSSQPTAETVPPQSPASFAPPSQPSTEPVPLSHHPLEPILAPSPAVASAQASLVNPTVSAFASSESVHQPPNPQTDSRPFPNAPRPTQSSSLVEPQKGPYTRNYVMILDYHGATRAQEMHAVFGDHCEWAKVKAIPTKNRVISEQTAASILRGFCILTKSHSHF
jgi:hypothetical protein